ncbi:NPP1-like protein [Phytophthora cinnamomi]|uniref:NPP1-like protein n=1 Tax=Phytophthora cinnamomi TaxID=4785 RepID=UPI00355A6F93|nr:NPP1-like protein [Phytophthora cinnamomi]
MNLIALLLVAVASFVAVQAERKVYTRINHDEVQPFPQPKPTTDSEKAAIKYKPQLHVSYGCQPYPAVQADGAVSSGLKGTGPANGECTGSTLGSQVYSRSDWFKDKWAIMYTWYLPKGRYNKYQHRHFWEVAVVWIDDPALKNSTMLGVSLNYNWRLETQTPVEAKYLDGSSVKLDSYFGFSFPKPKLRFTELEGQTQDLITWEQLTDEARDALTNANFDSLVIKTMGKQMPLKDDVFYARLKDAWPF